MTSVAKLELNSITEFQKELHVPDLDDEGNPEALTSLFYHEFVKSTWYTHLHVKIPCHLDDDNYVFRANTGFHYLQYVYQCQLFPAIRVKTEYRNQYRICWPHNLAINVNNQARFTVDDDPAGWFDHVWLDDYFQHCIEPGFRDLFNQCVGNLPFLENWTESLPAYETSLHQPWPYSEHSEYAFPLYLCSKNTTISHVYNTKPRVADLLRMAHLVTDKATGEKIWLEMKEVDFSVLDGVSAATKLKKPEMWGCYAYVTENEIDYNTNCKGAETKVFYYNDVVMCDQTNTETYGKKVVVNLNCKTPCKAIFWKAENVDATAKRNFSNYTTDSTNVYRGWNPIDKVTLTYGSGETPRIENMKSLHFDRMQSWYHMKSPSVVAGYNTYSLADNCMTPGSEVGLVFSKLHGTQMIFGLKNNDPFQRPLRPYTEDDTYSEAEDFIDSHTSATSYVEEELDARQAPPNFRLRVRLLVMKKLKIEKKDDKWEFSV